MKISVAQLSEIGKIKVSLAITIESKRNELSKNEMLVMAKLLLEQVDEKTNLPE